MQISCFYTNNICIDKIFFYGILTMNLNNILFIYLAKKGKCPSLFSYLTSSLLVAQICVVRQVSSYSLSKILLQAEETCFIIRQVSVMDVLSSATPRWIIVSRGRTKTCDSFRILHIFLDQFIIGQGLLPISPASVVQVVLGYDVDSDCYMVAICYLSVIRSFCVSDAAPCFARNFFVGRDIVIRGNPLEATIPTAGLDSEWCGCSL